jgi:ATP-dependent helicase/DNAse subunit B
LCALSPETVYSVTELEKAAECPFRFFLKRGLGVRPVDERERDKDIEEKASIPMVRAELELIIEVQTDEFWQDITTKATWSRGSLIVVHKLLPQRRPGTLRSSQNDGTGRSRVRRGTHGTFWSYGSGSNTAQLREKCPSFP